MFYVHVHSLHSKKNATYTSHEPIPRGAHGLGLEPLAAPPEPIPRGAHGLGSLQASESGPCRRQAVQDQPTSYHIIDIRGRELCLWTREVPRH
jgi:hypothetical protein